MFVIAPKCHLLLLHPVMTGCIVCAQEGLNKHVIHEWINCSSLPTSQAQDPERKLNSLSTLFSCFRLLELTRTSSFPDQMLMEVLMRPSGHQKERERKSNSLINPQITVTEKKWPYFL